MTMEAWSPDKSNLLQQVMQIVGEGVAITDQQGRLVFANRALERLLGYEPGELNGLPWQTLFPGRLRRQAEGGPGPWPFYKPGETTRRYEARLLHRDGSSLPALVSSCLLSTDGGTSSSRYQGILLMFTDLRERQHLQAQVEQLATPALMGQRIASVVHELSNSLTILTMQAQLLSKKVAAPEILGSVPPVEQNLAVIQGEARRMMQLVDNLRLSADPYQVNLETTDVNALIEATLDLQSHQLQAEGIQVTAALESTLPSAGADPYRLQQVLVNVINNARQAMAAVEQGRKLVITTHTIPGDSDASSGIQVHIADTGPGIPPDVMAHIFEPFCTTKSGNGMGLGLSICERIMKNHGGRIWAENNAGPGVTFVLELPAAVPKPSKPPSSLDRLPTQPPAAAAFCDSSHRQPALV